LIFLKESHPDKINDREFIRQRSELAALAYSDSIQSGKSHFEAEELALAELFLGLHFSKYDILSEILSEEFSDTVSDEKIQQYALEQLPLCKDVFATYDLHDSFEDTPEYEKLYTELTGKIAAYGL
jgi:hypothetical protein